jgi:TIR domain
MKLRIFLSYSRKDGAFTHRLADALAVRGYVPDFDQANYDPDNIDSGISAGDEWWQRLRAMIASADAMVFIVSPDSAASKACDEEIAYARDLGKRVIPVLRRPIDFLKAPPRLTALNIKIQFLEEAAPAFDVSLTELCVALDTDVDWFRESRRLTGLAIRWIRGAAPTTCFSRRVMCAPLETSWRSAPDRRPIHHQYWLNCAT